MRKKYAERREREKGRVYDDAGGMKMAEVAE